MTTQKIYCCHIIVHFMYVFKRPGKGISRRKKKRKKEKAYVQYILAFLLARTATYICM